MQTERTDPASHFENGLTFHHVGFVVQSIGAAANGFGRSLALDWNEQIFHDQLQRVRVSFLSSPAPGNPMIELVEPVGVESPVYRFLQRGGGLHHICYEVISMEKQLHWTKANRDLIVREPLPAIAFGGRLIAWVYTRNKLLVEYLQRPTSEPH